MSQPIISIENLSKSYLISHLGTREPYTSLRDTLSIHARNFTRRTLDTLRGKQMLQGDTTEEFFALRDVSFEVRQGDVLGIIGKNGAGKSTLLKVLSRITEPTRGKVTIRGRVASLLEVGTGFHAELSGRENIFLNGAILGMSHKEIKAKFDEIVDFAGVEKFLDTPVKRYSSGMYVRLAFAVAAHLEPEILIIDEVLAVGDAEFQKKCMGKMKDVAGDGRTVLFVSHNLPAILALCPKSLLLDKGKLVQTGNSSDILKIYSTISERLKNNFTHRPNKVSKAFIKNIAISNTEDEGNCWINNSKPINVKFDICNQTRGPAIATCSIQIFNTLDTPIFHHHNVLSSERLVLKPGDNIVNLSLQNLPLPAGTYSISSSLLINGIVTDMAHNAMNFSIFDSFYPNGKTTPSSHGLALINGSWKLQ